MARAIEHRKGCDSECWGVRFGRRQHRFCRYG